MCEGVRSPESDGGEGRETWKGEGGKERSARESSSLLSPCCPKIEAERRVLTSPAESRREGRASNERNGDHHEGGRRRGLEAEEGETESQAEVQQPSEFASALTLAALLARPKAKAENSRAPSSSPTSSSFSLIFPYQLNLPPPLGFWLFPWVLLPNIHTLLSFRFSSLNGRDVFLPRCEGARRRLEVGRR